MDNSQTRTGVLLGEHITNDYNVIRLLGKGGMGEVYLAEQRRVGRRRVALKVLSRACSEDPELARRFENEAASAGQIQHRNVVMIFESRTSADGQLYVAMEYVDGKTLRDEIAERGALPISEVIDITKQVCAGLGAAHRLGIVHRDIKPDNIMLSRDDDGSRLIKVLDFGIARLSEASVASRTQSGVVMGTPYYMSPEQALGNTGDKINASSDIYSLGMVVYQMLTGRVAFESDSWMGVMYKHLHEPPPPPREFRPELGWFEELEHVVLRALEKDRNNRPQTVQEFGAALEGAYRRAMAANPELAAKETYDATVIGVAAPFVPAATAIDRGASVPGTAPSQSATVETAPGKSAAPTTAGRPAFWKGRQAIAAGAVLIVAVIMILYFVRSKPDVNPAATHGKNAGVPAGPRPMPPLQTFAFAVVTLDPAGHMNVPRREEALFFSESVNDEVGIDMVEIPEGSFLMGAPLDKQKERKPTERPQRTISVPPFFMGRYEITEAQWRAVARLPRVKIDLQENPSTFKGSGMMPVENVSWYEAVEFCERLSRATGRHYRLPTEAEWEYACRAGTTTPFYFGETITLELVNYDANYPFGDGPKAEPRRKPIPVTSPNAQNAFGLSCTHGNVAEWCLDAWHDNYIGAPTDAREWEEHADTGARVVRGGSYSDGGDNCRSAVRVKDPPDVKAPYIGFRIVMVAQ